jgi:hypothetical protein
MVMRGTEGRRFATGFFLQRGDIITFPIGGNTNEKTGEWIPGFQIRDAPPLNMGLFPAGSPLGEHALLLGEQEVPSLPIPWIRL